MLFCSNEAVHTSDQSLEENDDLWHHGDSRVNEQCMLVVAAASCSGSMFSLKQLVSVVLLILLECNSLTSRSRSRGLGSLQVCPAVSRKHMEDVATVKVAFQEKTHANSVSYLTVQYSLIAAIIKHMLRFLFLISFLGTVRSWQVLTDG